MDNSSNWKRRQILDYGAPALLMMAGAFLLLWNLGNQFLWQDEAQTALIAKTVQTGWLPRGTDGRNFFSQELGAEYGPNYLWRWHTWLPFYVLAPFFHVLGTSTLAARLPFALFGVGTVLAVYLLAYELWKNRSLALYAGAIVITNVPFLILSRQCRYYSMAAFFSLMALYGFVRLVEGRKNASWLFVGSAVFLFHTHYIYFPPLLMSAIAYALFYRRDLLKKTIFLSLAAVAINVPWILWMSGIRYRGAYPGALVDFSLAMRLAWEFGRQLLQYTIPPLLVLLGVGAGVLHWRSRRAINNERMGEAQLVLLLLFFVLTTALLSVSAPAPFFRYLAPVLPVLAIVAAWVVSSLGRVHFLFGVMALGCWVATQPLPDFFHELTHDFDGPIEGIVRHLKEHGAADEVVAITYGDLPLKFYTPMRVIGGLTGEDLSAARDADWVILRKHVISEKDERVRQFLEQSVDWSKYRRIVLPYPDTPFENRESPQEHRYRTATNEDPVILYQRIHQ